MDPFPPLSSMTLSPQSPTPGPNPSNSTQNPTTSSIFRPRRSEDWHEYREIIEQLYRNDQLKLRDVKRIMERDYKFQASEKQYKDRLAAWHVRKNIKAKEVHLMIRKQQKRAARGKQTAFRVNGQEVDSKRIARFQRRYGDSWSEEKDKDIQQMSPEPTTPSDMTCYTPEPADEAATPISPPEIQSPSREPSSYPLSYDPNHIDSIPDLIIDDDSPFPISMHHNPTRRTYHHQSESLVHTPHSHAQHPQSPHAQHPHAHHPHPHSLPPPHLPHPHHTVMSATAGSMPPLQPVAPAIPLQPAAAPGPASSHRDFMNAGGIVAPPANMVHTNEWDRLDNFQTRLELLNTRLNDSMSRWNRDQDPNEVPHHPHHEGLGL
ncbi:hypothetical protein N7509_004130 [Penicillium cosmopolitanum]|uniref:Clr5 domain-containing protein n=1 Tax=Penicillium cosmopolitanum TaxID=1131564 RepID=A0A9W9W687_9EURO|nr:uncharacterized protein N7509_004130 [Penicillium cosmopolitanum]KAJ5404259.1 hypothetical protein N7509_004130 [Penicillium cosmopolitanum]